MEPRIPFSRGIGIVRASEGRALSAGRVGRVGSWRARGLGRNARYFPRERKTWCRRYLYVVRLMRLDDQRPPLLSSGRDVVDRCLHGAPRSHHGFPIYPSQSSRPLRYLSHTAAMCAFVSVHRSGCGHRDMPSMRPVIVPLVGLPLVADDSELAG